MSAPRAVSGLQRDVLHLYRAALRAARRHDPSTRQSLCAFARHELERHRGVRTVEVQRIEHLLRKGHRQLQVLQSASGFSWTPPAAAP